jgi:large subunit ribosomal protein L29
MASAAEMHNMNDDELAHRLAEAREEVFNLRFQLAMGKQDNSARLGQVRREVARALTIQHQRRNGVVQAPATGRGTRGAGRAKAGR